MYVQCRDRRSQRSPDARAALQLQLEHVARIVEFDAVVLADDLGRPIVAAGDPEMSSWLADAAMWCDMYGASGDPLLRERVEALDGDERAMYTAQCEVGGNGLLHLLALGRSAVGDIALLHAARGIERICSAL